MEKKRKLPVSIMVSCVMVVMTLLISVGYAAFNSKLNVKDIKAVVRIEKDVRVTGISVDSSTTTGTSFSEDYNVDSINGSVSLPQSTSTVTYNVEVTNIGTTEVGIFQVLEENLPSALTYSVSEYTLKSKICDSSSASKCTMGAKKTFKITIKYKAGASASSTTYPFVLKFDFRGFHKITYQNIDSTTNLPKEIMDGDTLTVTLSGLSRVKVSQNNLALTESQCMFKNCVINIPNVKGDLIIEGIKFKSLYATIQNGAVMDNTSSTHVTSSSGIDFKNPSSNTNGNGKYIFSSTKSNTYPIYYYRGDDTLNNNVLFADICWKIVRTTSTGGIKMVYSGDPTNGACPTSVRNGTSKYGLYWSNDASYFTLFYGEGVVTGKDRPEPFMVTWMYSWYEDNIKQNVKGTNQKYSDYLEDPVWFQTMQGCLGGTIETCPLSRFDEGTPSIIEVRDNPVSSNYVSCDGTSCSKIKYPIGLINVDEAMLAGISTNGSGVTPVTYLGNGGFLLPDILGAKYEVWPTIPVCLINKVFRWPVNLSGLAAGGPALYDALLSISLKNDVKYVNGDGSAAKPYEIIYG